MKEYPKGLPCALREGYGFESTNNISRTDMVSGRARQRIMFEARPDIVELTWLCSDPQALLFDVWSAKIIKADWFLIPLKVPGGMRSIEVRFTETPRGPVLVGVSHWRYTARCELRERPMIDKEWAEIMPEWVLMLDVVDLAINREWPQA
jgi:hypothetical protein